MGKQTDELREAAERAGVEWRAGLVQGSLDIRVDVGTATELRAGGESLTFEEGEDGLICLDAMSAAQAVAAVMGAGTCRFKTIERFIDARRSRADMCECDRCGYRCARGFIQDECFRYCPNCGRRIVDPTTNDVDAEVDA